MSRGANDQSGIRPDPPKPAVIRRSRFKWAGLALALFGVLAVVLLIVAAATRVLDYAVWGYPTTPMTADKADRLASAGPPPGSTLQVVEAWLSSQGIGAAPEVPGPDFSVIRRSADNAPPGRWMGMIGHQTPAECAGLRTEDVGTCVMVVYPDADRHFMGRDRITVYFFFNADGRLLKHWVDVFHDMP